MKIEKIKQDALEVLSNHFDQLSDECQTSEKPFGRLTVDIPRETHNRFKSLTAERGESMTDVVNGWIAEYIKR